MLKISHILPIAACLALGACDQSEPESPESAAAAQAADDAEPSTELAAAPSDDDEAAPLSKAAHRSGPRLRAAPGGKAAFAELEKLIGEHYVGGALSEDAFYTAAAEGVLDRLIQLPDHPINTLMSPEELAELKAGTHGKIVGVGVMIEMVADVVVIRDVIDGGPAQAAGLKRGDRILGIDGERLGGQDLGQIVSKIRGEAGTSLELFVQRDTEEWDQKLERGEIQVASVEGEMLDEKVGYLDIRTFGKNTAEEVDAILASHLEAGAQGLVLDLRECPGGLFDAAIDVASRFVPKGATIVTVEDKEGKPTSHLSEFEGPWQSMPVVVLVGAHTASGAEIVAAAIADNDRGSTVGETTMGKSTVESIHELGNEWAVKLSIMRFYGPAGDKGVGGRVTPAVRVPAGSKTSRSGSGAADPAIDHQLGAALELLEPR